MKKIKYFLAGLCLLSMNSFAPLSFAQVGDPAPTPSNPAISDIDLTVHGLDADIQGLLSGYGTSAASRQALFAPPYSNPLLLTLSQNAIPNLLITKPYDQAQTFTLQGIINTLTPLPPAPTNITNEKLLSSNPVALANSITLPLMTPAPVSSSGLSSIAARLFPGSGQQSKYRLNQNQALAASSNLDMNILVGPLNYQTTTFANLPVNQQQAAQNFIIFVSGLANPATVVDFSQLKNSDNSPYSDNQLASTVQQANIANYLGALRAYTAQVAAGLGNLYHLYAERIPVAGLGDQAGVPKTFQNPTVLNPNGPGAPVVSMTTVNNPDYSSNMSPLMVRKYMATRRLMDPNWAYNIQNGTPAQLQKEMLILLAEMRAENFNTQMELERLNATLSVLVLQNAQSQRLLLQQQVQNVQGSSPFQASSSSGS